MEILSQRTEEDSWYVSQSLQVDSPIEQGWDMIDEHELPASEQYSPSLGDEPHEEDTDTLSSLSDPGERPEFAERVNETSEEEQEAEVAGPIVGAELAVELDRHIVEQVYRHRLSGCCHLAKDGLVDPDDGDVIILKCGKIANRNFEEIQLAGNFLPYKCSRCFSGFES